jgi:signal transduction histidine kinase
MFDIPPKKLLGKMISDNLVKEDWESVRETLHETIIKESKAEFEARVLQTNGKIIDVLWSAQWVPKKNLLFCVVHDISRRKEAERLRQEVIAMVSHDLRTPLATISSFFEMLAMGMFGELSERGGHLLKVAESNIARMLSLTNDLLDLEKSKAGMLTVNRTEVALDKLLDDALKSVANLASNQGVHLEMNETSLTVLADSHRVTQVLVNLLSNAIKFSPKQGAVTLQAEEKNGMAIISVSDEGRGVPEQLKEAIFERFQQVEIADAVDKGGSGLGLAICKAIVDLHGGEIKVENKADRGCIFTFSLDIAKGALTAS